jgi:hypothetical protein
MQTTTARAYKAYVIIKQGILQHGFLQQQQQQQLQQQQKQHINHPGIHKRAITIKIKMGRRCFP